MVSYNGLRSMLSIIDPMTIDAIVGMVIFQSTFYT